MYESPNILDPEFCSILPSILKIPVILVLVNSFSAVDPYYLIDDV